MTPQMAGCTTLRKIIFASSYCRLKAEVTKNKVTYGGSFIFQIQVFSKAYLVHTGMIALYRIWLLCVKHVKTNTGTAKEWSLHNKFFFNRSPNHLYCCFALCCWQGILYLFFGTIKQCAWKVIHKKSRSCLVTAQSPW